MLAIFALVAQWRFTPPPRSLAAATAVSMHIHSEKAMAEIEIARDGPRGARVNVQVLDGAFRPLAAKEVTLVLGNEAAGIEPVRRRPSARGEVNWLIEDLRIPLAGHGICRWKFSSAISRKRR